MATKYITDMEITGSLKINNQPVVPGGGTSIAEVSELPQTGVEDRIYLLPDSGGSDVAVIHVVNITVAQDTRTILNISDQSEFDKINSNDRIMVSIPNEGGDPFIIGPFVRDLSWGEPIFAMEIPIMMEQYMKRLRLSVYDADSRQLVINGLLNNDDDVVYGDDLRDTVNVRVSHTTQQGTYDYGFLIATERWKSNDFSQLTDVAQYLYSRSIRNKIPASGTYVSGNNVNLITAVQAKSNGMMDVSMVRLSDGTISTIETGLVDVTAETIY